MRIFRIILVLVLASAFGLATGRADVVILLDGTVLHGNLRQENELVNIKGVGPIPMGKGFFMVDDNVRLVIFPSRQIPNAKGIDPRNTLTGPGVEIFQNKLTRLNKLRMENGLGMITQITPWNAKWDRSLTMQTSFGAETVKQKLTALTPHAAVAGADRYLWNACYLTKELGVEQVKALLANHPDLKENGSVVDPQKRLRIFRFLMQAGWYTEANQELDQLLKDAPASKDKVDEARKALRGFQAQQAYDEIDIASKAGQHEAAIKWLERFPRGDADEGLQVQFRALQRKYEDGLEALTALRRFLTTLPLAVTPYEHKRIFSEAAAAILADLSYDNHPRLKPFLDFAKQAERLRAQGVAGAQSGADLMALAVSGWLLGDAAAVSDVAEAIKLWKLRQLIREFQRTHNDAGRQALLVQIDKVGIKPEIAALVIRHLPPAEPEDKLPEGTADLQTNLPNRTQQTPFVLRLPREYRHGRSFPLLIVLNPGTEPAQTTLQRYQEQADQFGYMLAAVDWTNNGKRQAYGHTVEEHALVLDTLRDLQRRFNVDTDRVFLSGISQGAAMAYDVGLSHPDLFAGIVPICGMPKNFSMAYSSNAANLPFYVVGGDLAPPEYPKAIRRQFESWVTRDHAALYVEYKGRGLEWYAGELPYIFDWLNRKTREHAMPESGNFVSMRHSDNRFYWLSGDNLDPRLVNNAANWNNRINSTTAGQLSAKIGANNQITLHTRGFKQASIWLGPGMIVWNEPVSVSVNVGSRINNRVLTQSMATLLEDFYQRGDRQRLFFLRLDFGT